MNTGVTVDFNANLARFTSGVDKAINDLNKFQSNAERISANVVRTFGALGVGLGVGAFAAFIKSSVDAQDHLNDLAKTTRLSVEELAGLSSAARKSGSDLDGTAKAINKLAENMGKDAEKFKLLGVTAKDPLQAFAQLADVMNAIDDPQKRAAVGATALGKSWETSAPLMAEGGKAIQEMIRHGTELSKITSESAKAADELNDKWDDLKTTASGWGVAVANPVIDGINKIIKALELEVGRKPGSIGEFLLGPKREYGYKGPLDQFGLPAAGGAGKPAAGQPGKPTAAAIDGFIGGGGAGSKTPLQRMLEQQSKRVAELNALAGDEQLVSVESVSRQYDKVLEDRAQALAELHEKRMEQYRIETEGEEAVREHLEKTSRELANQKTLAKDLGFTFASAAEEAILKWESVGDVLRGLAQDVQRIFVRKTVTEPLGNSLSNLFGKLDLGSFFGSSSSDSFNWMPSFAGGGSTGNGPRSGGLDGQGGFLAMLHPQEDVVDRTRGGEGSGAVTVQLNFAVGIAQTVRAEVMAMMPQIQAATTAGIVDARRRGGAVRAAFAR